jgi:predicted CXXCH cytochrome family protein
MKTGKPCDQRGSQFSHGLQPRRLWRIGSAIVAIGLWAGLLIPQWVWAGGGPHQGLVDDPALCVVCHRTKNGELSAQLRAASQRELCFGCHGHSATGADTDVEWGIYRGSRGGGESGGGLRGGGFAKALMDPALTGSLTIADTTSGHTIDGTLGLAWGGGAISKAAEYGPTIKLVCSSCHNPHGNGNYRMLRSSPKGMPAGGSAVVLADERSKAYTVTYGPDRYPDVSYAPRNIGQWCAQCHTRYLAGPGSGGNASADSTFRYRHITEGLVGGCLACHTAHGTSATMGTYSGSTEWPDGTPGNGKANSRLLRVNNRGVCVRCHTNIIND